MTARYQDGERVARIETALERLRPAAVGLLVGLVTVTAVTPLDHENHGSPGRRGAGAVVLPGGVRSRLSG